MKVNPSSVKKKSALPTHAFNHRRVWELAGPMILCNLTTPMLGLVDTAVVGHLSNPAYLGAVALGSLVFGFIYWGFGFLRMGTTGFTAQALGKGDTVEIRANLIRPLIVSAIISILILLLQSPIAVISFWLVDGGPDVERFAYQYYSIRIWSTPAALANFALLGWLLGMQNARAALLFSVTVNAINIILDLVFVVYLEMDVDGVALASLMAEYVGIGLGIFLVRGQLRGQPGNWQWREITNRARLGHMLSVNQNIFIRTLCLIFAFAFFTAQGAKQGDLILAANAVLLNFQTLMAFALDGFAFAAEALVGKAVGSADNKALRQTIITTGAWSLMVALGFTVLYWVTGNGLINLLTDIAQVRQTAAIYLPWVIVSPIISVWCYLFDGIFIGATLSKEMRNTMLASLFCCYLPAWYLFQPYNNHGLWMALTIFMAARGLTMAFVFRGFALKPTASQ